MTRHVNVVARVCASLRCATSAMHPSARKAAALAPAPSAAARRRRFRRDALRIVILGLGIAFDSFAAGAEPMPLIFGVNEGVTYRITGVEVRERYREIAEDLTRMLRRPVRVVYMEDYVQMGKDLEAERYDLAYVHPAHYAIRAIEKANYKLVAVTKGYTEYKVSFLVESGAPFKSLADPGIHSIGLPDEDSITSWIARATLRDAAAQGASAMRFRYTRYQDAVPYMVQNGFAEVGATASSGVIKQWSAGGGKVMAQSRPVPIKALIASPRLPPQDFTRIQHYFLALDATEEGQRRLAKLGYSGFIAYDQDALIAIGRWLGSDR